ncbi:MAG: hypothetical protein QF893_09210 [Alphaproteobacteria bacterium]|jgi:hypothetical protein|nr:hypothetical protein [Alphaproteobacteria bacterium]
MAFDTVDEVRRTAHAFLSESARRYAQLAGEMHRLGKPETAVTFERLEQSQLALAQQVGDGGSAGDDDPEILWQAGDDGQVLPPDIADSAYSLTPVRALNLALHNNQRAITFLTEILGRHPAGAVHDLADRLSREILDQRVQLRLQRRRASRQREALADNVHLNRLAATVRGIDDYRRHRQACVEALARQLTAHAGAATDDDRRRILDAATRLELKPASGPSPTANRQEGAPLTKAISGIEAYFDALMAVAGHCQDEAVLAAAQEDAARLIPVLRELHVYAQ